MQDRQSPVYVLHVWLRSTTEIRGHAFQFQTSESKLFENTYFFANNRRRGGASVRKRNAGKIPVENVSRLFWRQTRFHWSLRTPESSLS
jgi:hypothetical protein